MPDDLGDFQQGEDQPIPEPTEHWAQKRLRQASEWARKTIQTVRSLFALLGPWGRAILAGLAVLLIAIAIGLAVFGGDLRQGSSPTQPVSASSLEDVKKIKQVLALAGNDEALRLSAIENQTTVNENLDKIKAKTDNQNLIQAIETAKSTLAQLASDASPQLTQKFRTSINEVIRLATQESSSTGANFKHITDAPIAKIIAVKSPQDTSKRRIYFYDKDGKELGNARIEIGTNKTKPSGFRQGDKATPTGSFQIISVEHTGQELYSSYRRKDGSRANMGLWKIRFDGPADVLGRGVVIHGNSAQKAKTLIEADKIPLTETDGCIEMTNNDLKVIGPLIKTLTDKGQKIPLEIKAE